MKLLAHRGFWKKTEEKNSKEAIEKAFNSSYGVETDIRDFNAALVISHDIATNDNYSFQHFCNQYNNSSCNEYLALNIKADGLSTLLNDFLIKNNINNYFVFDMSIPETLRYFALGMKVFIRFSEYEAPNASLLDKSEGIWLDIFNTIWFDEEFVTSLLNVGKKIAFVSPELHGRNHEALWEMIKKNNWNHNESIFLCTDLPDLAQKYFI